MTTLFDLDHNAGSRLDPRVRDAMRDLPPEADGNPHSPHRRGRAAAAILEDARERIAAVLSVEPTEVIFTSGGTEANNLAVHTGFTLALAGGRQCWVSPLEHPSVAVAAESRERRHPGVLHRLACANDGTVLPGEEPPAFASVILAHHELGVIQDLAGFAAVVAPGGLLHTDASQALGRIPLAPAIELADFVTLSPHKVGGPKGVGVLIAKRDRPLAPVLQGGSQELGRRAGTQCPRLAVGAATAVELAVREHEDRARNMRAALGSFLAGLPRDRFRVVPVDGARSLLPNTRTLSFAPLEARHLLPALDLEGVLVSHGAACTSGARTPSPALLAIGLSEREAACCVRVSTGPQSGTEEMARAAVVVSQALARIPPIAPRIRD